MIQDSTQRTCEGCYKDDLREMSMEGQQPRRFAGMTSDDLREEYRIATVLKKLPPKVLTRDRVWLITQINRIQNLAHPPWALRGERRPDVQAGSSSHDEHNLRPGEPKARWSACSIVAMDYKTAREHLPTRIATLLDGMADDDSDHPPWQS